jgi:CopG family nickel-responsive transcriptional regulator
MSDIVRFSVSIEGDLLGLFDKYCQQEQFATRSEAVRQLLRDMLTRRAWESGVHEVAGSLTLIYDHHRSQLRDQLIELQHDNTDLIISTLHAHLNHDVCMEVIALRGPAGRLQQIAARLKGLKGIYKGELVMASAQCGQARPSEEAVESESANRCEGRRRTGDPRQTKAVKPRKPD